MRYPIIIMVGKAGSGKDTVAAYLANKTGAFRTAQADPLKRFAQDVLGATDEQLWGPSEARNAPIGPMAVTPVNDPVTPLLVDIPRTAYSWLVGCGLGTNMRERKLRNWYLDLYNRQQQGEVLTVRYVLQTLGTEFGRNIDPNIWSRLAIECCASAVVRDFPLAIITDGRFRNEVLNVVEKGGEAWLIEDPNAPASTATHASETEQNSIPRWWFSSIIKNDKTKGMDELYRTLDSLMWQYQRK
jgi:hypothetical protein